MLKLTNTAVMNFENAFRGMRNPLSSWAKSDSTVDENGNFIAGEADLGLACRLAGAGTDHRKFIRQIFVSVDIEAPLYWWKEFDTYKVGTVANSTSTMHKIHSRPITVDDFSVDRLVPESDPHMQAFVDYIESVRLRYLETGDKALWYTLIQLLPSSYNQLRTVTMNYENLANIHRARRHHKLDEWHVVCDWIEQLPYAKELILFGKED